MLGKALVFFRLIADGPVIRVLLRELSGVLGLLAICILFTFFISVDSQLYLLALSLLVLTFLCKIQRILLILNWIRIDPYQKYIVFEHPNFRVKHQRCHNFAFCFRKFYGFLRNLFNWLFENRELIQFVYNLFF